jgi:hypothetical protein
VAGLAKISCENARIVIKDKVKGFIFDLPAKGNR